MSAPGTYLGFDYGSKRIGVAVGSVTLGDARPLITIANHNGAPNWEQVDRLLSEWSPVGLVVGVPLSDDGSEQPLTGQARGFARRLGKRSALPVHLADERYTTIAAQQVLAERRYTGQLKRRVRRCDIDAVAAAVILERWFEH